MPIPLSLFTLRFDRAGMKQFFLKVFIFSVPFIIIVLYCVIIDPYNVFHYNAIRDNGVTPNRNYIKMRYILDNPDKFDLFLFGSSRVGYINVSAIQSLRGYNMTYSMGIPKEHFANLETMIQNNVIPNIVLMGIDDMVCYLKPETHNRDLMKITPPYYSIQNNLAYTRFLIKYLNPSLVSSIPIIVSHRGNDAVFRKQFYENGGSSYRDEQAVKKYDWENALVYSPPFHYGIDNALADIQSIITLCHKHNIKLVIFTNPLHKLTYQRAVENGYIDFLRGLSEITDYYNFSGINDITTNNDNYSETSHYKLNVGDLIIDTIFNHETDTELLLQGFGYYVTDESKAELFDILK